MSTRIGLEYERLACTFLQSRGYRLLEKNYRSPFGEIDLIMRNKKCLVFVEVRQRRCAQYGGAVASIHRSKQRRIIQTAQYYLQRHAAAHKMDCRIDVIAFQGEHSAPLWLENAIELTSER